jgi:hypothetical protein
MRLFVDVCMATELKGFNPQELANTINGEAATEHRPPSESYRFFVLRWVSRQALRSSSTTLGRPS